MVSNSHKDEGGQIWSGRGSEKLLSTIMPNSVVCRTHSFILIQDSYYRIAGKFDGELNLAVWQSELKPPN